MQGALNMNRFYIALGSNIEPRKDYLDLAIQMLQEHPQIKVAARSSVYETEPVGYVDQSSFLNMVIKGKTLLSPFELLDVCQTIEYRLGRKREMKWGPRTIDLDILMYNNENIETEHLMIPHPRMFERAFVLIPFSDLDGDLPIDGITINHYIRKLSDQERKGVRKWMPISGEEGFDHSAN
ncbi:2-amino-4-hydroxy-6-hydroxymethyldihydropteridine diphosphokinase [Melghiribacillus thermohalophilus]|uniref:2-amino-4-hydroxy-6-hydroxymethyldihydropteridine diphosphokinase n=2 Tax=Melghiribacillus thermohalophilus TaxID=1324956 RepID=A0A4R3MRM8_9BACI|nr:2-amino-4-hydroxy-6-hydroxymethyldihydropteridine diphosphokinase [Melghiribacillus thermohalophilus]